MSGRREIPPTPLQELPPGDGPDAQAGELLRRLEEPAPFGPQRARRALERIRDRVQAPPRRRWWPWVVAPLMGAAAAAVVILYVQPHAPAVAQAPRLDTPRLVVLEGEAQAVNGRVTMRSGRLLVQTDTAPSTVEVPGPTGARVAVRERSVVEIRVVQSRVIVSAFTGSARVEWLAWETREVAAGRSASPAGETAIDAPRAAEVERILRDGPDAPVPPVAPVAPAAVAPTAPAVAPTAPPVAPVPAAPLPPVKVAIASPVRSVRRPAPAPAASPVEPVRAAAPDDEPAGPEAPRAKMPEPAPIAAAPKPAPVAPAPPPAVPRPSALALESASFERAVRALRHDKDPEAALRAIDAHLAAYPNGLLRADAAVTRVEALLATGRRAEARTALDHLSLSGLPRARELSVVRGELRAEARRCRDANRDFEVALDGTDELAERALAGRADCRARSGDDAGARADLVMYLQRFPNGRFADRARRALGH